MPTPPWLLRLFCVGLVCALQLGCTRFDPADSGSDLASDSAEERAGDASASERAEEPLDAGEEVSTALTDASEAPGPTDANSNPEVSSTTDAAPLPEDASDAGQAIDTAEAASDDAEDTEGADTAPDGGASSADALDAESPEDGTTAPCVDLCAAEGIFRCLDGVIEATERCVLDGATGCLFWEPYEVCQDSFCKGTALCVNGACGHAGDAGTVCTSSDPCMASTCDDVTESCLDTPLPGGACDDGEGCTTLDTCQSDGSCQGTPDASICPCSSDQDCLSYDPDGEACQDRYLCQAIAPDSAATACVFSSEPVTCSGDEKGCTELSCEALTGECVATPLPVDTPCEDSDPCTSNESCDITGQCVGFPDAVSCACDVDSDCLDYDEDGDACNGRFRCTDLGWASGAKACTYDPVPTACPEPASECLSAACVPATGLCIDLPVADGLPCDDADACSEMSTCQVGQCTGFELVKCTPEGACDNVACDPESGQCFVESIATSCCGNGQLEPGESCDTPASWCTEACEETECVAGSLALGQGCLSFDTGQGVLGSTFTVDFFIYPTASSGTVIASGLGVNAPWRLEVEPNGTSGTLFWREMLADGSGWTNVSGPPLTLNAWQHITLIRDASAGAQVNVSMYKDGQSYGASEFLPHPFAHAEWGWLGCQSGQIAFLGAFIDEFRWREGVKVPSAAPEGPLPSAGTLLLYHFDDVTPGVAVDASGWGRHGAWQGCYRNDMSPFEDAVCDTAWCNRSGLLFTPEQEGVGVIPPSPGMAGVDALTVEFYLRLNDTNSVQTVISQSSPEPGGPDWHIQAVDGGGAFARLQWIEGQETGILQPLDNFITSAPLSGDVTHHIAFVRSVSEEGEVSGRWYIDGEPGAQALLQSPKGFELSDKPIFVGSQSGSSNFLNGFMDELRLSKGALYEGEGFTPGFVPETPETLGLYRFDIGTGTWAYPELWGSLPPMALEGVSFAPSGATAAGPCP